MTKGVPIRVSKEVRAGLGNLKISHHETYDGLLRRHLFHTRARKELLKSKLRFTSEKATRKVLSSDIGSTREVLKY